MASLIIFSFLYFGDASSKAVIPLAHVGYQMIMANARSCSNLLIIYLFSITFPAYFLCRVKNTALH